MSERMVERDESGREIVYVSENCVPNSTPLKTIVVRFPGTHNSDFHNSQLPKIAYNFLSHPFSHIYNTFDHHFSTYNNTTYFGINTKSIHLSINTQENKF